MLLITGQLKRDGHPRTLQKAIQHGLPGSNMISMVCLLLVVLFSSPSATAAPQPDPTPTSDSAVDSERMEPVPLEVRTMTARIDELIDLQLKEQDLLAAPLSDDAEFLRRVTLDLTGTIPSVAMTREFLADKRPNRRAHLINQLLSSPRHPTHLAHLWRQILLPNDDNPAQVQRSGPLHDWLREQFVSNLRYDRFVAEFLSATGGDQVGPAVFYQSLEAKPEKLAAATSRVFLGMQIQCAECHDHPFDDWSQRDFWGYAAFFAQLEPNAAMMSDSYRLRDLATGDVTLPGTEEVVAPQFPSGKQPAADALGTRRRQLAIWMASRDNPYLAPAAVNRTWGQLFGRGLVNPIDDMGPQNPASHPVLMRELSEFFVRQGFDLRPLYQAIANTKAYQRTSQSQDVDPSQALINYFGRMPVRRMSAAQLYDSIQQTIGGGNENLSPDSPGRFQFISVMESASPDPTTYDLGVQQALRLMNGTEVSLATGKRPPGILSALAAPFLTDDDRIEILFLATFTRTPSDSELSQCQNYIQAAREAKNVNPFRDLLWAMMNSAEFQLNH